MTPVNSWPCHVSVQAVGDSFLILHTVPGSVAIQSTSIQSCQISTFVPAEDCLQEPVADSFLTPNPQWDNFLSLELELQSLLEEITVDQNREQEPQFETLAPEIKVSEQEDIMPVDTKTIDLEITQQLISLGVPGEITQKLECIEIQPNNTTTRPALEFLAPSDRAQFESDLALWEEKLGLKIPEDEPAESVKPVESDNSPVILPAEASRILEVHDIKLGALLTEFKFLPPEALDLAVEVSKDLTMPLGAILVSHGLISARQLQWTTRLQALLRAEIISASSAWSVVDLMSVADMSFKRALACVKSPDALEKLSECGTRIGDLLLAAEIVGSEDLETCAEMGDKYDLPIGKCLVLFDMVNPKLLETVVCTQRLLRMGRVTKAVAIATLRRARRRDKQRQKGVPPSEQKVLVRLGDLLVMAGLVTEDDVRAALEIGIASSMPIGDVLLALGCLNHDSLAAALILQDLVEDEAIDVLKAVYCLIDMNNKQYGVSEAIDRLTLSLSKESADEIAE